MTETVLVLFQNERIVDLYLYVVNVFWLGSVSGFGCKKDDFYKSIVNIRF